VAAAAAAAQVQQEELQKGSGEAPPGENCCRLAANLALLLAVLARTAVRARE